MPKTTARHHLADATLTLSQVADRLFPVPVDVEPVKGLIESAANSLSVGVDHCQGGDVRVAHKVNAAFHAALEAEQLIHRGHNRAVDWIDVARAFSQVARFHALEALWAMDECAWTVDEKVSAGDEREGVAVLATKSGSNER